MTEIQKANPDRRRIALAIVGLGAVAGVALMALARRFQPDFESWVMQDPDTRLRLVIVVLIIFMSGPLVGFAAYLWQLGRRIVGAERFPPPGIRLVRDTAVITGSAAVSRGRQAQVLAAALATCAFLLAFLLWRLVSTLRIDVP